MKDIWIYLSLLFIFSAYKMIEVQYPDIPLIHSYLEDLLFIPILLKSAQWIIQTTIPGQKRFLVSKADITFCLVVVAIYFEYYLPVHDSRFTHDPIDLIAYALGALFFWRYLNAHHDVRLPR